MPVAVPTHMLPSGSGSRAVTSVLPGGGEGDRGERAAGVAFQAFAAADPEIVFAVELDRLYIRAAEQVQGQARAGGPCIQGKHPAAAPQPKRPLRVFSQRVAIQRAADWVWAMGAKTFPSKKAGPAEVMAQIRWRRS